MTVGYVQYESVFTEQCVLHGAGHRQDVLVNQFDGPRPVGDLIVEVVGQSGSLQLQLLGLQRGLCGRLCGGQGVFRYCRFNIR